VIVGQAPPSEARAAWVRALSRIAPIATGNAPALPMHVNLVARRFGSRRALLSREGSLTYADLTERAGRYGNWAREQGLAPGDKICLMMPNHPDYVAIWLGISGIGAVVALLNTNLSGDALAYAVDVAGARHIIVDARLEETLTSILHRLPPGLSIWTYGSGKRWPRIDREIEYMSATRASGSPSPSLADHALLIYTSGTTGLPKAAHVSHRRVMEWSAWFAGMLDVKPDDRVYNCLPMYHSIGGVVAIGAMLVDGASVLIRDRFSATQFWDDVADGGCTLFQYIGEICRYLTESPEHPRESAHRLRLCYGNGLRDDVWRAFQDRFRVPRILEFYASTEGNVSLYNCEGRRGAIGRIPPFLAHRFPVTLIRSDPETGEPMRGADGFCQRCAPDEPGEALGRINGPGGEHGRPFEGYTDPDASRRKILRDVFTKDDFWFRTGDLMRRDTAGFFYFIDRLGDTFRWKGENVSTEEVARTLRACTGVADAVVYGVEVVGNEGRVGMAAIVPDERLDLDALYCMAQMRLPDYAQPLFLRLCPAIATTGTHKPIKATLQQEGFDPRLSNDPLYVRDRGGSRYRRIDSALHGQIISGAFRI